MKFDCYEQTAIVFKQKFQHAWRRKTSVVRCFVCFEMEEWFFKVALSARRNGWSSASGWEGRSVVCGVALSSEIVIRPTPTSIGKKVRTSACSVLLGFLWSLVTCFMFFGLCWNGIFLAFCCVFGSSLVHQKFNYLRYLCPRIILQKENQNNKNTFASILTSSTKIPTDKESERNTNHAQYVDLKGTL